jgi:hypothetical protein
MIATMTAPGNLRTTARALPDQERERRRAIAARASDHRLLTAVVAAGVGDGEWRSSGDCAARAFAVDDRTFRRWLADDDVQLSRAVREKLERLAWAFGLDLSR